MHIFHGDDKTNVLKKPKPNKQSKRHAQRMDAFYVMAKAAMHSGSCYTAALFNMLLRLVTFKAILLVDILYCL